MPARFRISYEGREMFFDDEGAGAAAGRRRGVRCEDSGGTADRRGALTSDCRAGTLLRSLRRVVGADRGLDLRPAVEVHQDRKRGAITAHEEWLTSRELNRRQR